MADGYRIVRNCRATDRRDSVFAMAALEPNTPQTDKLIADIVGSITGIHIITANLGGVLKAAGSRATK